MGRVRPVGIDVQITEDGIAVLSPEGDLDLNELPIVEARVAALLDGGTRKLVWDLDGVGLLPSTAAGVLLQTAKRVRAVGGRMVLACGHARVLGTLRTMGVLELFRTHGSRAEAVAALQ